MSDKRYEFNQKITDLKTGRKYLLNTLYPDVPVTVDDWYVITTEGDRYDLLSQRFYNTVEYWWVIAIANSLPVDTLCPEIGIQIRIPAFPQDYIYTLEQENQYDNKL